MRARLPFGLQRNHLAFLFVIAGLALVLTILYLDDADRGDTAVELSLIGQDTAVLHTATSIFEVNRFREAVLAVISSAPGEADIASVRTRFDVLWNNLDTANSGAMRKRFDLFDEEHAIEGALALMARHESRVARFDPGDRAGAFAMLAEFEEANLALRRLLTLAYRNERALLYGVYDNMLAQRRTGRLAGIGVAIVSLLVLIGALIIARRDKRLSRKLMRHAQAAEEAAETRSRFLTMVSHELRTPMNGVLGLLDVIRTLGLEPPQAKLAGAAAASGHEMLLVIEALLTLSDIRDGRITILQDETPLDALVADIRRRVAPLDPDGARPANLSTIGTNRFVGDAGRLSQALAFIIHYVRKTLMVNDFSCMIEARYGVLTVRMELPPGATLPWGLETILATGAPRGEDLAAEALAPLAGRSLLDLMDARFTVSPAQGEAGRASVAIRIPQPTAKAARAAAAPDARLSRKVA